jgi:membrane-associated phospholipid phosphatase
MPDQQQQNCPFPLWAWFLPLIPLCIFAAEYAAQLDHTWFVAINHYTSQYPDILWTSFSLFGNGWSVLGIALPLVLLARRPLYAAVISGIFAGIFSSMLKNFFNTARPAGVLDQNLFHIIGEPLMHSAMPSGHTMTAFSIATAIYFSLSKPRHRLWLILFFVAFCTGLSRIAVGAHWPEDTLVGASLGILSGLIGALLAQHIPKQQLELNAWPVRILFVGSMISIYFLAFDSLDFTLNQTTQIGIGLIILCTWARVLTLVIKANHKEHV